MKRKKGIIKKLNIKSLPAFVKWIIIPLFLFIFGMTASLFYSTYQSFTVLQFAHNLTSKDNFNAVKLYKNKKITGVFTATENHLGIIAVRFNKVPKPGYDKEDVILFKLRQKGNSKWLYENKYHSGAITSGEYYPFGFLQIDNSVGKTYEFEIASTKGSDLNAIEISRENPIYIIKHKFSKKEIVGSLKNLFEFTFKKIVTSFTNYEILLSSTVFLLPLLFYLIWIVFPFEKLKKNKHKINGKKLFQLLVVILILSDIILYKFMNTGLMLALIGLWLISVYINKSKSSVSFLFSFFLFVLSVLGIYFSINVSINKTSTFAYIILIVGFLQSVWEYKTQGKNK